MDISKFAPNKFKGDFKEDAEKWIFQFQLFAKASKLSDEEILEFLPLLFDDHALLWYQYLPNSAKENKETLISTFLDKYGTTVADRQLAFDELSERRQRRDESVTEYINDVTNLSRKTQLPDDFLIQNLMFRTLPEYLMSAVGGKDPDSPQEMEKRLRIAEGANKLCVRQKLRDLLKVDSGNQSPTEVCNQISNQVLSEKSESESHLPNINSVPVNQLVPTNQSENVYQDQNCQFENV